MSPTGCERCGNTSFEKSHLLPSSAQVTQLHDILRSNNLPPGSVASSFQSVIDQSPLELKRYAAEIQRLEKTLAELKSDLASLESYTNGCRSMFSPLRRLPNELLVEIFDLCSPPGADLISDTTTPEEEEDRVARNYLLQLSQVHILN